MPLLMRKDRPKRRRPRMFDVVCQWSNRCLFTGVRHLAALFSHFSTDKNIVADCQLPIYTRHRFSGGYKMRSLLHVWWLVTTLWKRWSRSGTVVEKRHLLHQVVDGGKIPPKNPPNSVRLLWTSEAFLEPLLLRPPESNTRGGAPLFL